MSEVKPQKAQNIVLPESVRVESAEHRVPAADGERPRPRRRDHAEVGLLDGGVDGGQRAQQRHARLERRGRAVVGHGHRRGQRLGS